MWKRLNKGKDSSVQISAPKLVDSTYDAAQLEQAAPIRKHDDNGVRPPLGRQNTDETVTALPELCVFTF